MPVNTQIFGSIETRDVEAYSIPRDGQEPHLATTYTCVVLGDSTSPSWETQVRAQMKQNGHLVTGISATPVVHSAVDSTAGTV